MENITAFKIGRGGIGSAKSVTVTWLEDIVIIDNHPDDKVERFSKRLVQDFWRIPEYPTTTIN